MHRDNRRMYMAHVGFMSDVVTVRGSRGMFVVFLLIFYIPIIR